MEENEFGSLDLGDIPEIEFDDDIADFNETSDTSFTGDTALETFDFGEEPTNPQYDGVNVKQSVPQNSNYNYMEGNLPNQRNTNVTSGQGTALERMLQGIDYKKATIVIVGAVLSVTLILLLISKATTNNKSKAKAEQGTITSQVNIQKEGTGKGEQTGGNTNSFSLQEISELTLNNYSPETKTVTAKIKKKQITLVSGTKELLYTFVFDIIGEEVYYYTNQKNYNGIDRGEKLKVTYTTYTTNSGQYICINSVEK